jgi:hypothetical protein
LEVHGKDLENILGGGDSFTAWIVFRSDTECDGHGLENRLGDVMSVATIKDLDVEIAAQIRSQCATKFLHEGEGKVLGIRRKLRRPEFELRAVAQIDYAAAQGLVHGYVGMSVATNAFFVSKGFLEALSEDDSGVLYGVVKVDFDITINFDIQIDERVA